MKRLLLALSIAVASLGAVAACLSDESAAPPGTGLDAALGDGPAVDAPIGSGDAAPDAPSGDAGDGGGVGTTADLGPLASFCVSYAKGECDRRAHCYPSFVDDACESDTLAYCHMYARAEIVPAMNAGLIAFDAAKAATCFATPFDDFCSTNNFFSLEACRGIFTGTVANGGACLHAYFIETVDECANGGCVGAAAGGKACGAGSCVAWLDAGAACQDEAGAPIGSGCGPDARCVGGACAPNLPQGAACSTPGELCRNGYPRLSCVVLPDGGAGTICDLPRPVGGACRTGGVDLSITCLSLICTNGQCIDTVPDGGQACFSSLPPCPAGTACASNGADPPSCMPLVDGGGACATSQSSPCVPGYQCVDVGGDAGRCDPLPGLNAPCNGTCAAGLVCSSYADASAACLAVVGAGGACRGAGDDTCAPGLVCGSSTSTCVAPVGFGGACGGDRDCDRGLYCDGTRACRTWKLHGDPCARDGECTYGSGCDADAGRCASTCVVP